MRFLRTKTKTDRVLDTIGDSLATLSGGASNRKIMKAGVIAGGVAALTAGSAAISSIRRRTEGAQS